LGICPLHPPFLFSSIEGFFPSVFFRPLGFLLRVAGPPPTPHSIPFEKDGRYLPSTAFLYLLYAFKSPIFCLSHFFSKIHQDACLPPRFSILDFNVLFSLVRGLPMVHSDRREEPAPLRPEKQSLHFFFPLSAVSGWLFSWSACRVGFCFFLPSKVLLSRSSLPDLSKDLTISME